MTNVTTEQCEKRHKTMHKVFGWFLTIAVMAVGGSYTVSLLAYSTASEAAADLDAGADRIRELHKDVREIRAIVGRIEKNGGG